MKKIKCLRFVTDRKWIPAFLVGKGGGNMSWWQKLKLKIFGKAFLRMERREGWTGSLPIYALWCKEHGIFEDYKHGFYKRFRCPECLKIQPQPQVS